MKTLGRVGFIGRFKPLHNGAALALETLCSKADVVKIGIGSSNKYNARNPFTAEESREMIDTYLSPRHENYEFIIVPDFAHLPEFHDGQKWKEYVKEHFGKLDYFATANPYVRDLLQDSYNIIHPAACIPREQWLKMRATEVRMAMASGGNWQELVPEEVAHYLEEHELVQRFRDEFSGQILAAPNSVTYTQAETKEEEYQHTRAETKEEEYLHTLEESR